MSDIPPEIVADILSRLPAKCLMRFSCVSKPWYALINSIDFLKMHFNQAKNNSSSCSHKLLLRDSANIFSVDIDLLDHALSLKLKPPFSPSYISNYCNGLIVVSGQNNSLAIWNPFTRKYKNLPPHPVDVDDSPEFKTEFCNIRYGLGYDSVNDDYKVLRTVVRVRRGSYFRSMDAEAKVYSLKSNSWKVKTKFIPPVPHSGRWDIPLHGALHTLNHWRIVGFDLANEEKYGFNVPDIKGTKKAIFALEGLLGFHCTNDHTIDLWIMKEYRVEESWVKLLSLAPPLVPIYTTVFPITYSKNGQEVLLNMNNELVWFDLECKTFTKVDVQGLSFPSEFHAKLCVETLISPDGYGDGGENENRCWIDLQQ